MDDSKKKERKKRPQTQRKQEREKRKKKKAPEEAEIRQERESNRYIPGTEGVVTRSKIYLGQKRKRGVQARSIFM